MIVKSHHWQKTALAVAAAAFFGLWGSNAAALSLGRITVQSALGEPLRAEIDVPDINTEEAASLKTVAASPDAFRAAGMEYNPAMSGLQATLQRRTDGRAYIRLSSVRAINDPFVDMILEARWASGRIVRDYTMLFDPPSLRQAAPAAPSPAQIPASSSASRTASPTAVPAAAPALAAARPAEPRMRSAQTATPAAMAKVPSTGAGQVRVKPGDTASKIAAATKPANVSLDQMLVALLRANPAAFMGDNVSRIKAGSVMNVPTAEQAGATPAKEATQIIVAQSRDFNDFRRKLAGNAPSTPVAAAERQASGSVQATVEDKKPVTTAPDKLTLSKGAIQGLPAEDQLAKERSAKEAANRVAEITKDISDLSRLGAASSAAALDPVPSLPASAAAPVAAPQPAAPAVAKLPLVVPVPSPMPGLVDQMIENPLVPVGAVGLIALLAGFGLYRIRQRKNAAQVDSSFLESRLGTDSFFGGSGGQRVDTHDSAATSSPMIDAPSQLDAVDNVDPVVEADVYLAYGRDLQAVEILEEALRSNPERIAIHQKLLEIFAKRRDTQGFNDIAILAFKVTRGDGLEWERICELGRNIEPGNALYQQGKQVNNPGGTPSHPTPPDDTSNSTASAKPQASQANAPLAGGSVVDLDLDFSLYEEPASALSEAAASNAASAPAAPAALDNEIELITETLEPFETSQVAPTADAIEFFLPKLEVEGGDLAPPSVGSEDLKPPVTPRIDAANPAPLDTSEPKPPPAPDFGMLEFDFGSLSLDLGDEPKADTPAVSSAQEDPLATKLALAQEFSAIGDDSGARVLLEEVIAQASGDMKIKAQRALSNL